MIRPVRFATAIVSALLVAGCGGGGGGTSPRTSTVGAPTVTPPVTGNVPNGAARTGTATLSLAIPAAASASATTRRPAYVSAATQSVAVYAYLATAAAPPTATTVVNVGANAPGCASGASAITCTITVPAQYGSMTFIVKTYDNVLATGNLLSQATITTTIGPNQAAIPLVLSGVVSSVKLALASVTVPAGGGTTTLNVNALDPNGATIIGSGTYSVPITLSSNDKTVTFAPATVTGPGQPVTVTYTAGSSSTVTISASAAGISANALTPVVLAIGTTGTSGGTAYLIDMMTDAVVGFPAGANANIAPSLRYNAGTANLSWGALATSATGDVALATYSTNGQTIFIFNGPSSATPVRTIQTPVNSQSTYGLAYDTSGNLYTASSIGVLVYAPGASGAAPPARQITGSSTNITLPINVGVDTAGDLYELELSGLVVNKFAPAANGNVAPVATIVPSMTSTQYMAGFAVSADGFVAVDIFDYAYGTNKLEIFAANGSLSRTISSPALNNYTGTYLGFAPNDDLYATAANVVYVFPSTANGNVTPSRGFGGSLTAGFSFNSVSIGPAQAAPTTTTVSGDMLALAASKTWNYTATPNKNYGGSQFTVTTYSDPQTVSGASSLVAFMLPSTAADALPAEGGVIAGAIGVTSGSDGYHAQTFGSVSNDSFGLVPGAPLLVPATLTLGQTYVPYPGVTATVSAVGTVPGLAGCPNSPTTGATVVYSIAKATETVSYVPGCGITDFVADSGTEFVLTSTGSHPEVGQQSVARRVLNASLGDTLHAVWRSVFTHN